MKDRLAGGLKGEKLGRLRLEFFDAGASSFGDRAEENQGQTGKTGAAEGVEESAGSKAGRGRDGVQSFVFGGVLAHAIDSEPHACVINAERRAG